MLTEDQIRQYREDGWALVPGAVDADTLAALNAQLDVWIEESRAHPGNYGRLSDGKARFDVEPDHTADNPHLRRVGNPTDISDLYRDFLWEGPFADMAVDLYGPDIRCEYSRINVKAPGSGFKVYFHQDHPFEPHTNPDVVVTLFFMSDMTEENGCLCIVPGSHRERHSHWQDGKFTGTAAPDKQEGFWSRSIPVTGKAGDVLLMDTWMLHASRENRSSGSRRMLICDYAAADSIALGPMKIPTDVGPKIVRGKDTRTVRLCGETLEMPENYTEDTFFILQEEKMAAAGMIVSAEQRSDFQCNGAIVLRAAFLDWVGPLRRGIERNIAAPSDFARIYQPEDGGGQFFFGDYCNWSRIPEYREFLFDSDAAEIAAGLMSSRTVRLFHEHVLVKEPGNSSVTPWHHDQPYYCVDGFATCSIWIALDPVPRDVAPEFVVGSQRWGRQFLPDRFNGDPLYDSGEDFEPVPDIDGERHKYQIVGWDMEPGDAVAFHFCTVHGAPANSGAIRRRAFSCRWIGEGCTFAERPGTTSPPFPDVKLKHGDPMDAPEFPVVFRAAGDASAQEARR